MKRFISVILVFLLAFTGFNMSQASAANFSDTPEGYRFYKEIKYLTNEGIINGYPDNTFRPDQVVTRGAAAIMIGKALDLDGTKGKTKFPDVGPTSAASGYIQSAVDEEIISGFPDGTFKPDQLVTRGQLAIFLTRAFKLTETSTQSFTDVTSGMAAYSYIQKLLGANITSGYPDGTFKPGRPVSRGEFSAFIARALDDSFKLDPEIKPDPKPDLSTGLYVIPGAPTNFQNCTVLKEYYPYGVKQGHPAYQSKMDRDNDGWACEA